MLKRQIFFNFLKNNFLSNTIIVLLSLLMTFAILEVYVRIFLPKNDLNVLTGTASGKNPMEEWAFLDAFSAYKPKPGKYAEGNGEGKTVNRYGFISTPEISIAKPADTIRIVFLGGSSTAGTGVNLKDTDTWPWKTVEMIRAKTSKKVDFINAAAGGYCSFESYGRLWSRIRYFSPDIVVVYHGWNEMYYFKEVDNIILWRTLGDGSWSFEKTHRPITYYEPKWIDPLIKWSQALIRIRLRIYKRGLVGETGPHEPSKLASGFDHRGLDIWRTNLKLIREACKIFGAKLFVSKQATLIVPDLPMEERKRCRYDYHGFDHDAHIEAFQGIYDVIDQEIPAGYIIDTTKISGQPECFYDHVHLTPQGTTEVAAIISEALIPAIQKRENN